MQAPQLRLAFPRLLRRRFAVWSCPRPGLVPSTRHPLSPPALSPPRPSRPVPAFSAASRSSIAGPPVLPATSARGPKALLVNSRRAARVPSIRHAPLPEDSRVLARPREAPADAPVSVHVLDSVLRAPAVSVLVLDSAASRHGDSASGRSAACTARQQCAQRGRGRSSAVSRRPKKAR